MKLGYLMLQTLAWMHRKKRTHIIMKPLVSIIVPIYKVEPYLQRCLDSIVNQTYTSLEIILVDDGSPDGCPKICDEYATKDNRIVVIHKENGGLSDARNAGFEICNGEYIYFMDSDDELISDSIERMVKQAVLNSDADIVLGEITAIPQNIYNYDYSYYKNIDTLSDNYQIRQSFYREKNKLPVNAVDKLIKKAFIKKNNLYFKKGLIHEDELWMFFVVKFCKKMILLHKPTYIRYINPESITTSTPKEKNNLAWGIILDEIFSNIDAPCWQEQFFTYSRLLFKFYIPRLNEPIYKKLWKKNINLANKHKMPIMSFLTWFYLVSYPILKGHGTGFIIWFITKFFYKQNI